MRTVLALVFTLLGATSATAQSGGDRYGGTAARAPNAQPIETQGLRALTWSSKSQVRSTAPQAPPEPPAPARPQPMSLAAQFDRNAPWAARDLPPPPSARPQSRQPAVYPPFQPQAPYYGTQVAAVAPAAARAPQSAPAALPTSLYSPPPALRGPVLAGGPQAPSRRAVSTPIVAAAPAVAPPAPAPQQMAQAAPHVGEPTRLYSLHRAYGMTPDAIPEPPKGDRYVFIGPPDGAPQGREDDDDDDTPPAKRDRAF